MDFNKVKQGLEILSKYYIMSNCISVTRDKVFHDSIDVEVVDPLSPEDEAEMNALGWQFQTRSGWSVHTDKYWVFYSEF